MGTLVEAARLDVADEQYWMVDAVVDERRAELVGAGDGAALRRQPLALTSPTGITQIVCDGKGKRRLIDQNPRMCQIGEKLKKDGGEQESSSAIFTRHT